MQNSEYIDKLMRRLGQKTSQDLRKATLADLNFAIRSLETKAFIPWFLETREALPIQKDETEIDLPKGFIREVESQEQMILGAEENTAVHKILPEDLRRKARTFVKGVPKYYALEGDKILVFPTPEEMTYLRFHFFEESDEVKDDNKEATNKWLVKVPNLMLSFAGYYISAYETVNDALARKFQESFALEWRELRRAHEARQHTNVDYGSELLELDLEVG